MNRFEPKRDIQSKYVFYTGKGGVGKTSVACATAIAMADDGKKVLLVSTDPASNLQDVFSTELTNEPTPIKGVDGLMVANLDPVQAANEYKESVIAPYRGKLPDSVLANMEEQLSGSCTVEIAAFNEFSHFITDKKTQTEYDYILFDTAPTGHTLRMLQLPSAWTDFINTNQHGASCLGQLSGLEEKKEVYRMAVDTLADGDLTTLVLVSRPEISPLKEAERASVELQDIGVKNQMLVINGVLETHDDTISDALFMKQQSALKELPVGIADLHTTMIPLRAYNITGIENLRNFLVKDDFIGSTATVNAKDISGLSDVVDDLYTNNKKVIFTMGKGGVGKTTIAAAIAMGLAEKGARVHLATTDPAAHLKYVISEQDGITMSHIDEQLELEKYKETVLSKARETMSGDDLAYIEEDLRSPCTQEIAVFRAFAEIVDKADDQIVVIDTAPTGHTLLLLDSTQSYHKEVERTHGESPESVQKLLPRLRGPETEVIIVTLAEATPYYEASRLEEDLHRAGLKSKWWVINSSLFGTQTTNKMLKAKAGNEIEWINQIDKHARGCFALIPWSAEDLKGEKLKELIAVA
ncbi:arsenical pump-driving ATPase [Christensenellaceae bacterium OttesenSCG-928-K19]|nr:arsenical pump-driving ATPase [Christensenellaceae bacterium OttesenSCG-928-K19]